jgi:hypothetical protein
MRDIINYFKRESKENDNNKVLLKIKHYKLSFLKRGTFI